MRFRIGDKAYCKIRGNSIVTANAASFDIILNFEIIGKDDSKYLLLIPNYYNIRNSWNIKEEHIDKFLASPNYLDRKAISIPEDRVVRINLQRSASEDGMFCSNCNEFYPMAEPNQSNGSLICYLCRTNPFR